ncbi:MAG: B12-binding domain-containing radical SAM protein [Candidatus Hodarchaeota archaeon]
MKILVLNPATKETRNVMRDVLYGCWCKGKRVGGATIPPLSLLYVATVLKSSGFNVTFLDAQAERKRFDEILKKIINYNVLVISTSTMTFREDVALLAEVKRVNSQLKTIIFGSHPTFMPCYALDNKVVDIIVRREPEYIIRDIISAMIKGNEYKNIKGIGYKEGDRVVLNDYYPFIDNLDELPFPDRSLFPKGIDYFNPIVKRIPYTTAITSRGCPAQCIFCTAPAFMGKRVRCRSAESVIEELEQIKISGYKEVFLRDETFTFFKERNIKICEEVIRRKIDISWICNARVGTVDKEMMALMKMAGCHYIKFGVESCVQEILDSLKKGITVEQIEKTFRWAHEVGIDTHAHFMIGNPGDSSTTLDETIEVVKKLDPTTASFGISTPYPGTELFSIVAKKHPEIQDGSSVNLRNLHIQGFFTETYCDLSKEELNKYQQKAYRDFYMRPTYIIQWLGRTRTINELRRLILAGTYVFDFFLRGE